MKALHSFVSLCHVSLALVFFAAGLTLAGCGPDSGAPDTSPAQVQASPNAAAQGKAKAKGKPQIETRRDLHREKAEASKDSQ
jgi:hypothetical protein